jgi:galactose mutarotase-like enzyme
MNVEKFGESRLGPVQKLVIGTEPGPVLELLDLGATVHRLWVTGGDGVRRNVVLGHATPDEYLDSSDYIGATVGRYANRIRAGRFELDGRTVEVGTNDRGNLLHGGPDGFDRRVWEVVSHTADHASLRLDSPAGDQGFPGNLVAHVRFEVTDDSVGVSLEATTDAATVVNLTSHAYFNLDGDGSGPMGEQLLLVAADEYLPVDDTGIPLDRTPVEGTPFDLRRPTHLGPRIEDGGFDHNFVLSESREHPAATLASERTHTRMDLLTDQPGLQVYTGSAFDGSGRSTTGHPYGPGDGLALEPQLFPDTPNRPDFGSAVLRWGETWRSRIVWRFGPLS